MKVSELQENDIREYIRMDEDDETGLKTYLDAAIDYVKSVTGLPLSALEGDCLDNHSDITIAVMALCQDMYDNRSIYVEKSNPNQTVDSILCLYSTNIG